MNQSIPSTDPKDVEKVRSVMEDVSVAMVTTRDAAAPGRLVSRPMGTQRATDEGDLYFLTTRTSSLVHDIAADPQVNVAYASAKAWVSLSGTAILVDDRAQVEELWSRGSDMFLDGGPENPDNVVVRVDGATAELWGGQTMVGTAVKTLRSIAGNNEDSGTTVVDLP